MFAAIVLLAFAVAYRLILGLTGSPVFAGWENFSPIAALALCGPLVLPRRFALWLPLAAVAATDIFLNAHHGFPLFNAWLLPRYAVLFVMAIVGLRLAQRPNVAGLLGGAVAGALLTYIVGNTCAWVFDPAYAKTFAGWFQANTTGHPAYAPAYLFLRNSLIGDVTFTAIFAACLFPAIHTRRELLAAGAR